MAARVQDGDADGDACGLGGLLGRGDERVGSRVVSGATAVVVVMREFSRTTR